MKFTSIIYTFFFLIIFTSCEKEDPNEEDTSFEAAAANNNIANKYRLLDISANAYHDYFKITDNTVGFNSLKSASNGEHSLVKKIEISNEIKKSISLNRQKIPLGKNSSTEEFDGSEIYGKTISLNYGTKKETNKNSEDSAEIKLYVPKKLNISKPVQQTNTKTSILAYYKNFVLEWNADPKNQEGLMVAVEYLGETLSGIENDEMASIVNVDHIENDNGKYILKQAMFDDVPNLSFINIILLRGNVDIREIEGETYKTYAESHQRIPVLLVKDLNSVKGFND